MPAINIRPTKRAKTTAYLPDDVFHRVVVFLLGDKEAHQKRFAPVLAQLTVLSLFLPITPHYDDDVRGDDSQMVLQHHATDDIEQEGRPFRQFDIRTETTWETRETIEWVRKYEEFSGQFYADPKNMPNRYRNICYNQ